MLEPRQVQLEILQCIVSWIEKLEKNQSELGNWTRDDRWKDEKLQDTAGRVSIFYDGLDGGGKWNLHYKKTMLTVRSYQFTVSK